MGNSFITQGTFIDISRVSCSLPQNASDSYILSISNDKVKFSVKQILIIITSVKCFACDPVDGKCDRKVNIILLLVKIIRKNTS